MGIPYMHSQSILTEDSRQRAQEAGTRPFIYEHLSKNRARFPWKPTDLLKLPLEFLQHYRAIRLKTLVLG